MNRDEAGKIFVGGLSWNTTQDMLRDHFSKYGQVVDCVVMKNPQTGKSRGFGFVTFRDPSVVEIVLTADTHNIDGRNVDAKECNSKAAAMNKFDPSGPPRHSARNNLMKTTKIFLGGLPNEADESLLKTIFSRYGLVKEVSIMMDPQKQRSRGFGFLTFETEESVNEACKDHFVEVNGKKVECKRAEPRSGGGGGGGGPMMGGRGGGGPGPDRRMRGPQNGGYGQGGPPYGQQEWGGGGGGGGQWNQSSPHMSQGPPRFQQPSMGYQGSMNGGPGYQQPPYQQGWGQQPPQGQPPQQAAPSYNYSYSNQQAAPAQQTPDPYAQPPVQSQGYGDQAYGGQPAAAQPVYGGGDPGQQAYGGGAQYSQRQSGGAQAYHPYRR